MYALIRGNPIERPLLSVQIAADMLIFDKPILPNLYELPEWLLDEIRLVIGRYNAHQRKKADS